MLDTHPAHALPDHATIQRLSEKALDERVEVSLTERPAHDRWLYVASSTSTDGQQIYNVFIHAPDPLGLDEPITVHCTCPAGVHARPCKHSALALRTLNLDMSFSRWLFLTTEQAEQYSQRKEQPIE